VLCQTLPNLILLNLFCIPCPNPTLALPGGTPDISNKQRSLLPDYSFQKLTKFGEKYYGTGQVFLCLCRKKCIEICLRTFQLKMKQLFYKFTRDVLTYKLLNIWGRFHQRFRAHFSHAFFARVFHTNVFFKLRFAKNACEKRWWNRPLVNTKKPSCLWGDILSILVSYSLFLIHVFSVTTHFESSLCLFVKSSTIFKCLLIVSKM